MILRKETIEALVKKGINARWYPEESHSEYAARMYKQDVERYVDYYKDCVGDNPHANKLFETMEELEESAKSHADISAKGGYYNSYDATMLYITYDNGRKTFVKKENVKSKVITEEYILKLVEKNEKAYKGTYGQFALAMQELCKKRGLTNKFCIYPTTYGIGVLLFYNFNADEHVERVKGIMQENGIEYYNEYSDAHWVYRFKVSKKAANIEKLRG